MSEREAVTRGGKLDGVTAEVSRAVSRQDLHTLPAREKKHY